MKTNNAAEVGKAIEGGAETIEVGGDLAYKIIRTKATGKTP